MTMKKTFLARLGLAILFAQIIGIFSFALARS